MSHPSAGEILALRLRHCDLRRGVLRIEENEWQGHIGTPKGQRTRHVVMTARLRATLLDLATNHPAPDGRLIRRQDGTAATKRVIDGWLHRAQRTAGLPLKGPHVLRHTFCSRLAASGAAPRAIQELAGHRHSTTTDRYLHLTPRALQTAIGLLEARPATPDLVLRAHRSGAATAPGPAEQPGRPPPPMQPEA